MVLVGLGWIGLGYVVWKKTTNKRIRSMISKRKRRKRTRRHLQNYNTLWKHSIVCLKTHNTQKQHQDQSNTRISVCVYSSIKAAQQTHRQHTHRATKQPIFTDCKEWWNTVVKVQLKTNTKRQFSNNKKDTTAIRLALGPTKKVTKYDEITEQERWSDVMQQYIVHHKSTTQHRNDNVQEN